MNQLIPGTEVRARGIRWEVVYSQVLGSQALFRLRGLEGALAGQELDLLHPFEPIEPIIHAFQPQRAGRLREWSIYHQAFLLEQTLGSDAFLAAQPGRLRLEPYQLVPVLRAIRMSRPRLLLADGVGLGKTIQAGLILTELVARRVAHRILIVSPAGPLLDQWKTEMSERFGLRLEVVDRALLEEIHKRTELGANPFDHIPLGLVSIDFLKQERVLDLIDRSTYDAIVIDEAHHCVDLGAGMERDDSQRRRLAQVLARKCDALLLLTATPHDGNDRSFASLCELLDPSLVNGRGELRGNHYREHVVRRLKRHVKDATTGLPLFKEREVTPIPVVADPNRHPRFIEMQRALLDLVAPELRRAFRAHQYSDVLSFIALLKRSVSTVAACAGTLQVVAERFQRFLSEGAETQESRRQRLRTLRDCQRKLERFGTTSAEEEQEREHLEAEDLAQRLADIQREVHSGSRRLKQKADVLAALDDLVSLAQVAEDPKLERVAEEILEIRRQEPGANVLVYTEYTTSQAALAKALRQHGLGDIVTMNGDDDEKTRTSITARFRAHDKLVLVSTDAAAEGLNLHDKCHHLIHLELPFNPNRLEQRNGRIDRYGQKKTPLVKYLFLRGTFEERVLLRLIAKYERQRARLTFVPNTLGLTTSTDASAERLLKNLLEDDSRLFRNDETQFTFGTGDENETNDAATRDLLEEIDKSLRGFEKAAATHSWLADAGLNADERQVADADRARGRSRSVGIVDLAKFVTDAVLVEGGELRGRLNDETFALQLPHTWTHGLDGTPGLDNEGHVVRLTTRLEVTRDASDRPVGFVGRAHPLVRRALDRVRHLSFGASAKDGEDVRVSLVQGPVAHRTLLYTYLGRLTSAAGREFERVLAARVVEGGVAEVVPTEEWLALANPDNAVRPQRMWEQKFASWAPVAEVCARAAAKDELVTSANSFLVTHLDAMEVERNDLTDWIAQRASEIIGPLVAVAAETQPSLLASLEPEFANARKSAAPSWVGLADPADRLAGFASDHAQPASRRSEAEGALRIYRQRRDALDARLAVNAPELVPLGLLMVLPEGGAR